VEVADLFAQVAARSKDTAARLHGEVAKRMDPELHRALFAAAASGRPQQRNATQTAAIGV